MKDTNIIPLQQLYLLALCEVIKAEKYEPALQDMGEGKGQIWLIPEGTTAARFKISFQFQPDAVKLGAFGKDLKGIALEVSYFDGLDKFMEDLQKYLRAGLLTFKRAA